jgi:hypothetical protein
VVVAAEEQYLAVLEVVAAVVRAGINRTPHLRLLLKLTQLQ